MPSNKRSSAKGMGSAYWHTTVYISWAQPEAYELPKAVKEHETWCHHNSNYIARLPFIVGVLK